jgi:hypothetical protein
VKPSHEAGPAGADDGVVARGPDVRGPDVLVVGAPEVVEGALVVVTDVVARVACAEERSPAVEISKPTIVAATVITTTQAISTQTQFRSLLGGFASNCPAGPPYPYQPGGGCGG